MSSLAPGFPSDNNPGSDRPDQCPKRQGLVCLVDEQADQQGWNLKQIVLTCPGHQVDIPEQILNQWKQADSTTVLVATIRKRQALDVLGQDVGDGLVVA